MKKALESSDRDFLEQLQRLGGGTVQQICTAIGVTATAVRQRLSRLLGAEFVSRELVRTNRGRPHYRYQVSEIGLRQLGDNYGDLATILWREMRNISDPQVRAQLSNRVRDALSARFGNTVTGSTIEERFWQLQVALEERGFDIEVDDSSGLPILKEHSCPYQELASNDRSICEMEEELFQKVLGVPMKLSQCFLDGHNYCQFETVSEGA